MNSRERVDLALNHRQPDYVPMDFGSSMVTGMHVSTVYKFRQALGLDGVGTPVKVVEPYQMLGEIKPDLIDALGLDVVPLMSGGTLFGFQLEDWKRWTTFDGTPVLVPGKFNTDPEPNGDLLQYPEGDKSAPASGRMPAGGFYIDSIVRQEPIDDDNLNVEDNLEEFVPISDELLDHYKTEAQRLYTQTDKALFASFPNMGFGDIALVPAPWLKHPKGIRDIEEWYISTVARRDYVYQIFERQCEITLANLEKLYQAVSNKVSVVFITGTDFGTQKCPFISPQAYCDLYRPFHKEVNGWVHKNTTWKTFIHSCGSIMPLIEHFIDAGFDILNPVQCSAANMDPAELKSKFGDRITFWGGGVDTQQTLPFGTPDEVCKQVKERIEIFGEDGGFVFNTIHNVQAKTPVDNLLVMFDTVKKCRGLS
ncbi:MAG: uroporphyrinogen decarboxylase family protein [Planctomycetota bacterium]|jgi:hypothetical protein